MLRQVNPVVLLGMLVTAAPLVMGILVAVRPSERNLALMRPLSLAGIFASVSTMLLGLINSLVAIGRTETPDLSTLRIAAVALAETAVPVFVGFAFQAVGWLCVAVGLRRSAV
jgi:hypothetical protein